MLFFKKKYTTCLQCGTKYENKYESCPNCSSSQELITICANCNKKFKEEDKYCRCCGAPRSAAKFIAKESEIFACIYGPPFVAKHKCEKCNFSWKNSGLGRDNEHYCPKCGNKCIVIQD